MFNPDLNPLRAASGTTAGTAATLLTRVLLVWGLVSWLMACAQAKADDAAPDAAPEVLPTRDTLFGNWGGVRDTLAQHGVRFDFWTTGFAQNLFQGTGDQGWDFGGRADLLLDADSGQMGLWQGGGFHAHLEYRTDELPGERAGVMLPLHAGGHFPVESGDDLIASSLYLSQRFGDSTRLLLGKINVIDLLARHPFFGGWGTDRFQNVAFVAPPNGITPAVIKGAVLTHAFTPYVITAMVFDPNDRSSSNSINDLFADGVSVSLGLSRSGVWAGRSSTAGITAVYSTAEDIDFRELGLPPGTESAKPAKKGGAYNVMIEGSRLLVESADVPGQGLGVYVRAAVADGNPNLIQSSLVTGLAGHSIVPGRPQDSFGVGYFFYNFSNELRNAFRPTRRFEDEQGVEVFYVFVPTPWLQLAADLQWVRPADGANAEILLGGLRARIAF